MSAKEQNGVSGGEGDEMESDRKQAPESARTEPERCVWKVTTGPLGTWALPACLDEAIPAPWGTNRAKACHLCGRPLTVAMPQKEQRAAEEVSLMGMFDYVQCDYPLPDGRVVEGPVFQTKDFDCGLDTIRITRAGRLVLQDWHSEFHGDMNFYGEPGNFIARFTKGQLQWIKPVSPEVC